MSYKPRGTIYLAGPIANTDRLDAFNWRAHTQQKLRDEGVRVLSPLRAKGELASADIGTDCRAYQEKGIFFTTKGIMTRDYNDVQMADALIVNLWGAKSISIGTVMELGWAYMLRKPAVVLMEPEGNPHDNHPMMHEAISFRVETLEEAVQTACITIGTWS